jgi:hypothetical protein
MVFTGIFGKLNFPALNDGVVVVGYLEMAPVIRKRAGTCQMAEVLGFFEQNKILVLFKAVGTVFLGYVENSVDTDHYYKGIKGPPVMDKVVFPLQFSAAYMGQRNVIFNQQILHLGFSHLF